MNSNQELANEKELSSGSCSSSSITTPMYMTPSVIKMVKQEQSHEEKQVESVLDNERKENQMSEEELEESRYEKNSSEEGASSPERNEPRESHEVTVNQATEKTRIAKSSFTQRNAWGNFSYADLITRAIMSSPNKRMTLQEIYAWISDNIPYFMDKKNGPTTTGWKNSVRHTLSIRKRFIRLPNLAFGSLNYKSLWTVDPYAEARRRNPSSHPLNYQTEPPRLEAPNWSQQLSVWTARPLDRATQTEFPNTCMWCSYCGHLLSFTGNPSTQDD